MKRIFFALALVVAGPAFADPAEGTWKTKPDDNGNFGNVIISPCGDKLCGVLVKSFNGSGKEYASDNIGKKIVWDMVPKGNGKYAGMVWAPDRDKTYKSKMVLKGNKLSVKGCIVFICRGSDWTRVE
jgi:uncharacterized protein (DUF2147 family)